MAHHFDLEEQEQLDQLKHFWNKYGNLITWLLIAVLGGLAAWNGWQYWQRKSAVEAAALYDELEKAEQARDTDKVKRVWSDMQAQVPRSAQAQQGALLAARTLLEADQLTEARDALKFVVDKSSDDGLVAVARLRLSALDFDAKEYDAALKWLDAKLPEEFMTLVAERRGDILLAQGKQDEARQAYQQSYDAAKEADDHRRLVEAKLNALGVNPAATDKP
ncbi:MAG TPA: tetratricopeptide repeat protein [Macromonas sp.]|nr:tetratricopeptide repeat protein [Macromonas sp.]